MSVFRVADLAVRTSDRASGEGRMPTCGNLTDDAARRMTP